MSWFYRIGAFSIFVLSIIGETAGYSINTNYLIIGWLMLILAEICDLKEIIKNDRGTKHDCDRDRGSN